MDYGVKNVKAFILVSPEKDVSFKDEDIRKNLVQFQSKLDTELDHLKRFFSERNNNAVSIDVEELPFEEGNKDVNSVIEKCSKDLSNFDALVFAFLGISVDKEVISSSDDSITVDSIVAPFKPDKCAQLSGRPKLFLIQTFHGLKRKLKAQAVSAVEGVPKDADIFLVDTTFPLDWNGPTTMEILDNLSQHPEWELCDLFTQVNGKIQTFSEYKDRLDQKLKLPVCSFWSTLRGPVYI